MARVVSWREGANFALFPRMLPMLPMLATLTPLTVWADDVVVVRGSQAGGFVSRARIEESPRTITDAASLVEPLPGVHVRRLGADDSFATLSIRGSSSAQVAVYLAGVPLSGGADPTLDLATLPLWPGVEAKVHRSFAPAALGRGSLGGTLEIVPLSAKAPEQSDVWGAIGAYGARRLRVGDVREIDGLHVATGISASRSTDDFSYLDPLATASAGHDVLAARQNAGHADGAGLVSIAAPLRTHDGEGTLTTTLLAQARRQELPGPTFYPTRFQRLDSSRMLAAVDLTVPVARDAGTFGVRAWGRREGLSLHDDPVEARLSGSPSYTDDAILAAGGSAGWKARPMELTSLELRVDGSAERFVPGAILGGTAALSARRTNAGLALDTSLRLPRVTLAASGRVDAWVDSSADGPSRTIAKPTGNLGAEAPVGPITLAAHGGYVARPASFVERYGNRGAFIGDPNLRPESAVTVDAGASGAERLGPVRVRTEVAGFASWADDLITYVYAGAQNRAKATNIGSAHLYGVEASATASAYGGEARLSYTGLATENTAQCQRGTCPPLPGRPAHDLVGDLSWALPFAPLVLRYGVDVVAGTRADQEGNIPVPARVLQSVGAKLAVPHVRGLTITLDVRNLLDVRVAEYAGALGPVRSPIGDLYSYPLPGRRALVSVDFAR